MKFLPEKSSKTFAWNWYRGLSSCLSSKTHFASGILFVRPASRPCRHWEYLEGFPIPLNLPAWRKNCPSWSAPWCTLLWKKDFEWLPLWAFCISFLNLLQGTKLIMYRGEWLRFILNSIKTFYRQIWDSSPIINHYFFRRRTKNRPPGGTIR